MSTGINIGFLNIFEDNNEIIYPKKIIENLYIYLLLNKDNISIYRKKLINNNIKNFLYSLLTISNDTGDKDNIILLINIILKNIFVNRNNKISKFLFKHQDYILNENKNNNDSLNIVNSIANDNIINDNNGNEPEELQEQIEKYESPIIKEKIIKNNDEYHPFNQEYFLNMEKEINCEYNINNSVYFNDNGKLLNILLNLLSPQNNLIPILFKCITDNISFLMTQKMNCSELEKLKNIYLEYRKNIFHLYQKNQKFHSNAYNIFNMQYKVFLSLENFDYDKLIKEGHILFSTDLEGINISKDIPDYLDKSTENIINNNIINFMIIHDLYYSYDNSNHLFKNKFLLKFSELTLNKQYFLLDLNDDVKYYSCQCNNKKSRSSFIDCTLLIFNNYLYLGNSSSNPNYTRLINKYSLSNFSIYDSEEINNCVNIYVLEDESNDISCIQAKFCDNKTVDNFKEFIMKEIKIVKEKEKQKFKDFLKQLE